ncbi:MULTISPECIES: heat-inducible transcriptional repressor HrcA [Rheinheimera]|uniref:Heat-inducible transcription repressor HrcA n=1 Tax=Rheinheimera marina TaxID=1774958 RepID=A0ABV9JNA0_9GAMM
MKLCGYRVQLSRPELILKLIVEQYLADGLPVSSKLLADHDELGVSSATVRNTMMQLEQQGFIRSPHTSAGRVPTTSGIRLFIDKMLQFEPVSSRWQDAIQTQLTPQLPVSLLCQQAGQLLADLTGLVSIVSAPKGQGRVIRQVDLVRLATQRLLLVVIDEDGDILHRVLYHDDLIDQSVLGRVLCLLNAALAGEDWLDGISRLALLARQESGVVQVLVQNALAQLSLDEVAQHQPLIFGQHQLMQGRDYQTDPALQQVAEVLSDASCLVQLLRPVTQDQQTKLLLGLECGIEQLAKVSLVCARYRAEPHGFIALLGPSRMNYGRFVPLVEAVAQRMFFNLNHLNQSP